MDADKKVLNRLQELIERGKEIEKTKKSPPPNCIGFDSTVDSQAANQWHTSAKSILAKSFGRDSEHYALFEQCCKKGVTYSPLHRGIGILAAAKEDLEHGYVQDIRNLVAAEMFSDLLGQASELLQAGYFVATGSHLHISHLSAVFTIERNFRSRFRRSEKRFTHMLTAV